MSDHSATKVILTTTSSLEGWKIKSYLGVVSCHVVAGTGIFSDLAAGFSDFFGGRSEAYRRQLDSIDAEALSELRAKALRLGANALIGVRIDHDEISGKEKQMFMCTAHATAVRATAIGSEVEDGSGPAVTVEAEEVGKLSRRKVLLKSLLATPPCYISKDDWKFICVNRAPEFLPWALGMLSDKKALSQMAYGDDFIQDATNYISIFPSETTSGPLCRAAATAKNPEELLAIIAKFGLVDLEEVWALLDSDDFKRARFGAMLMKSHKASYRQADLARIIQIRNRIEERFQRLSPITEERGIFGRKNVWKCTECGASAPAESDRCGCLADVFGFAGAGTSKGEILAQIDNRIALLDELLSR